MLQPHFCFPHGEVKLGYSSQSIYPQSRISCLHFIRYVYQNITYLYHHACWRTWKSFIIQYMAITIAGGLHKSELIQHSLVDHYIPFLPLERHHVELCIRDEIIRRGHTPTKELIQ